MADTPFRVLLAVLVVATVALTAFYLTRSQIGLPTTPRYDVAGGDPEAGREALAAYGCGACHQIRGVARARGRVGPPLTDVRERHYLAGRVPNTPENMIRWIQHPQRLAPGSAMPDLGVSETDARDMAAYLYALR